MQLSHAVATWPLLRVVVAPHPQTWRFELFAYTHAPCLHLPLTSPPAVLRVLCCGWSRYVLQSCNIYKLSIGPVPRGVAPKQQHNLTEDRLGPSYSSLDHWPVVLAVPFRIQIVLPCLHAGAGGCARAGGWAGGGEPQRGCSGCAVSQGRGWADEVRCTAVYMKYEPWSDMACLQCAANGCSGSLSQLIAASYQLDM